MVTLLTLKNISVHCDYFPPIESFIDKFPVYTNYLSGILLVETDLVYNKTFLYTQCDHSIVNLQCLRNSSFKCHGILFVDTFRWGIYWRAIFNRVELISKIKIEENEIMRYFFNHTVGNYEL